MGMRLTETIYHVSDIDAAVRFYTDVLGFSQVERFDWGWARLEKDGAHAGLLLAKFAEHSNASRLSFQADSLEEEVARLVEAGVDCDEIKGEPGTTRAVNFRDADGNVYFLWEDGHS